MSKNIYQRLHAIMEDVSYVKKEDKKVNNQYKFVSHDAVTAKIRPAMLKHGVAAIPSYFDISVDGNRTNCSVSMTFVNIEQPEDSVTIPCAGFGQGIDPQDKGAGKAMSYAYKYALLKVFALETGDDPEKDNIDYAPKVPKASKAAVKEPLSDEEARKVAEDMVNAYLVKLEATKEERDLINLQADNHKLLKRVNEAYPDLAETINKATARKRV